MTVQPTLLHIIEANPSDRFAMVERLSETSVERLYCECLVAYWKNDVEALNSLHCAVNAAPISETEKSRLDAILRARIGVRQNEISPELIESLLPYCESQEELWRGEVHFILAMCFEIRRDYDDAKKYYLLAQADFERSGAIKKSLKSLHNAIAAQSHITPDKRLLFEYQDLARRALRVQDVSTAGVAYLNLSREYHIMGAQNLARKTINDGIGILKEGAYGSYEYYLSVCHRAQLYLEDKRYSEAQLDIEEAKLSELPEVKGALATLQEMFPKVFEGGRDDLKTKVRRRTPTWSVRAHAQRLVPHRIDLTEVEGLLLGTLSQSPRSFDELVEVLYGTSVPYEQAQNRLKQVLHRLRKKSPDLIKREGGRYYIADEQISASQFV